MTLERRTPREIAAVRQLRRALRELDEELASTGGARTSPADGTVADAARAPQPFT